MDRVAILHTTPVTIGSLKILTDEIMPEFEVINILDDSLLIDVMKNGGPNEEIDFRINNYITCAEKAGCRIFMSACSSIGESVEKYKSIASIPIIRIDEPMAEMAVKSGHIIGVIATVETTLNPTINIINKKARELNRDITIVRCLKDNAYKELIKGNAKTHDEIVLESIQELISTCDVIVLAQASMARVLINITQGEVPILTSPTMGIKRLKEILVV